MLDALLEPVDGPMSEQRHVLVFSQFTAMLDLITAQTDKLAVLTQHKQGLLQQLFPAMDEAAA